MTDYFELRERLNLESLMLENDARAVSLVERALSERKPSFPCGDRRLKLLLNPEQLSKAQAGSAANSPLSKSTDPACCDYCRRLLSKCVCKGAA